MGWDGHEAWDFCTACTARLCNERLIGDGLHELGSANADLFPRAMDRPSFRPTKSKGLFWYLCL